ncbi:cytokine receptor common subunit beta-like isoform X2 [Anguilla rostrata]|uniref:cytokine receptor common subunit beta-like isoform X2 n=1 Tax=Anguilla rostrata TaxID=7938 RepID=UPI0030D16FCF
MHLCSALNLTLPWRLRKALCPQRGLAPVWSPSRMLVFWALRASLLPALALASESERCPAQNPSTVLDSLECYNDYNSYIRCSWREDNRTHSQAPLSLFHWDEEDNSESACEPRGPPVLLPDGQLAPHCQYNTTLFGIWNQDHFFFKTPHSPGLSRNLSVSQLVRVRPPHSLSQRAVEGGGRALRWNSSYPPSSILYPTLNYQVKYRRTGQDWTVLEVSEEELVIESDSLAPGCRYEAGVRSRGGKGRWSDWSPLVEWKTEEAPVPGPYNLQCEFDGETTMSCSWELQADLAQLVTYHLSYRTDPTAPVKWCCSDGLSVDTGLSALRLSCSFSVSQPEQLLVELTPSYNTKMIEGCTNIRPNPPDNVMLEKVKEDWKLSWTPPPRDSKVPIYFEVRYWTSDTPEEANNFTVPKGVSSHQFPESSLLPSTGYSAAVRALVTPGTGVYEGLPSDWSEHVHWNTHPAPWPYYYCILFLMAVVLCLLLTLLAIPPCRRRVKVWVVSVPSPFKSKVLKEMGKKSTNNSLAYQKVFEGAHISKIEVLKVQEIECSPHASEDPVQRLWLTTAEEDGPYQQVSGQGAGVPANASLSGPGVSPSPGPEPQSEGAVSGPSVEDGVSLSPLPTAPKTPLQCGSEYVEVPQNVSPAWSVEETEPRDVCIHIGCPLLGPAESETELPLAPKQLGLDPGAYMPIPCKTQEVIIRQNQDCSLLPDLGTVKKSAAPPSVPPAGSGSGDLAGDRVGWLEDIKEDYAYVKLSLGMTHTEFCPDCETQKDTQLSIASSPVEGSTEQHGGTVWADLPRSEAVSGSAC